MMNIGTHVTHCCAQHGCKYGNSDCPVKTGTHEQEYPCEECRTPMELKSEIAALALELAFAEKLEEQLKTKN